MNEASVARHRNRSTQVPIDEQGNRKVSEPSTVEQGNINLNFFPSSSSGEFSQSNHEFFSNAVEKSEEIPSLTTVRNQIVLHGQMNQQLASAYHSFVGAGFSKSILSTFDKSVMEQTRSNDLKAFEIGLIRRKLQLKESQLALSSYANMLEKIKVFMGISKAFFKEEKLRNQMLDTRHAEFLRRCIDVLVSGLIIMSGCLGYGTYIFSDQRIMDATLSCSDIPKVCYVACINNLNLL